MIGGIYSVLFYHGRMDMPPYDYANVIFILLKVFLLKIPCWNFTVNNFEQFILLIIRTYIFLCSMKQIDRIVGNKN